MKKVSRKSKSYRDSRSQRFRSSRTDNNDKSDEKKIKYIDEDGFVVMNLSNKGITELQTDVCQDLDIEKMNLSGNNIRRISSEIANLTKLINLNIRRNLIECRSLDDYNGLPKELVKLNYLTNLNISECNLAYVPMVVWRMINLKYLNICKNKINILDPDIGNLISLETFNAQQTNILSIPSEISFCVNLKHLLLWGNNIETIPENMKELKRLEYFQINCRNFSNTVECYMEELLRNNQCRSEFLPSVLFEIPKLKSLDLEYSRINNLPSHCNRQLQELYIQRNYFKTFPQSISNLKLLRILDISNNLLTSIPDEVANLVNLDTMKFDDNNVKNIPEAIKYLTNLITLSASNNKIRIIPDELTELVNLKVLILSRNKIEKIPVDICRLVNLETLELTENKITKLPISISQMKNITTSHIYDKYEKKGLWLTKNPLTTPPSSIWKNTTTENIYTYLDDLKIKQMEQIQRIKLILIGATSSGKSTFAKALMNKSYLEIHNEGTCIADNYIWHTNNNIEFMLIDLGGNELYHSLYELFFDINALYLLIYDHHSYTNESHYDKVQYWLNMISMYSPGSSIKIIGTHGDLCNDEMKEENYMIIKEELKKNEDTKTKRLNKCLEELEGMIEKYKGYPEKIASLNDRKLKIITAMKNDINLDEHISIVSSVKDREGIQRLINNIEIKVTNKSLFGNAHKYIPNCRNKFGKIILKQKKDCLNMKQIELLSKKYKLEDNQFIECVDYLRSNGSVIWLKEIPNLNNIVFHNPRKLIDLLKTIFDHQYMKNISFDKDRVYKHKGFFNQENFQIHINEFLGSGKISYRLLKSLLFYKDLEYNTMDYFINMCTILNLIYTFPEPELITSKNIYTPYIAIPIMNGRDTLPDLNEIWAENYSNNNKNVNMSFVFPVSIPIGLFEKFACRINENIRTRYDWKNLIIIERCDSKALIRQLIDTQSRSCRIEIHVKTIHNENDVKDTVAVAVIHNLMAELLSSYTGVIWYVEDN